MDPPAAPDQDACAADDDDDADVAVGRVQGVGGALRDHIGVVVFRTFGRWGGEGSVDQRLGRRLVDMGGLQSARSGRAAHWEVHPQRRSGGWPRSLGRALLLPVPIRRPRNQVEP